MLHVDSVGSFTTATSPPQERSPDQFGAMFCTLPTMTPGYLHPPLPISSQTVPPRLPPPELTHRKVLNGTHQHGSAGSNHQGTYRTSTCTSTCTMKQFKLNDTSDDHQCSFSVYFCSDVASFCLCFTFHTCECSLTSAGARSAFSSFRPVQHCQTADWKEP